MITYKYTDSNICVFTPSRQINKKTESDVNNNSLPFCLVNKS